MFCCQPLAAFVCIIALIIRLYCKIDFKNYHEFIRIGIELWIFLMSRNWLILNQSIQ